jgi:hypothetical protein
MDETKIPYFHAGMDFRRFRDNRSAHISHPLQK